jgi:glycosyltransferase involved in cell wall biosynthesis
MTRKTKSTGRGRKTPGERVSLVVCTLDEEENIGACIGSAAGVDEVVVADDGSRDATVKVARSLGARVFRRRDWSVAATRADVRGFTRRFGWPPAFSAGSRVRNGHLELREAVEAASSPWVLSLDADERVTWDLARLRAEVLPGADQVVSEFVHSHKEDGSPTRVTSITKLFRKEHSSRIGARTHTCLSPAGRVAQTKLMRVDHWQAPGHRQSYVLPILEYSVLHEDDQRSRFYLGREYYYYRQYDRALALLDLYLERATWQREIGQARLYAARCYWESGRGNLARESCLQAVLINPEHQEALALMATMYNEPWKHKWLRLAGLANNEDVLF